jgi:hypothetical protein
MPSFTLSWDLFIVVFFAIVMSYSFIIGKEKSVRAIIATYVSVIAVLGITAIATRLLTGTGSTLTDIGLPLDATMIALGKIFLFALFILIFMLRSGIDISYTKEAGSIMNIVCTGLFGFSAAGLIVSTVLTYAAGSGILDSVGMPAMSTGSTLTQLLILNQDLWYTLPAFLIIVLGFVQND